MKMSRTRWYRAGGHSMFEAYRRALEEHGYRMVQQQHPVLWKRPEGEGGPRMDTGVAICDLLKRG